MSQRLGVVTPEEGPYLTATGRQNPQVRRTEQGNQSSIASSINRRNILPLQFVNQQDLHDRNPKTRAVIRSHVKRDANLKRQLLSSDAGSKRTPEKRYLAPKENGLPVRLSSTLKFVNLNGSSGAGTISKV
jgi:hypothetical protein